MALNLLSKINAIDNKRIDNYVRTWGTSAYCGNEIWLKDWADSKKKLFHLLQGNLIYRFPAEVLKNRNILRKEILKIKEPFFEKFYDAVKIFFEAEGKYCINHDIDTSEATQGKENFYYSNCFDLVEYLIDNKYTGPGYKYISKITGKTYQLQYGGKMIKSIQKFITFIKPVVENYRTSSGKSVDIELVEKLFKDFSEQHSMCLNEKKISGSFCISIHPLDFLTMSDNDNDWHSCMSWINNGCYHIGTVEMMNSNNVVCCYIESKKDFCFSIEEDETKDAQWNWNSKKYRQLFYVTKDIIVSGKAYPYNNEDITKVFLDKLRALAAEIGWTYTFGPEQYNDMKHINTYDKIEKQRTWLQNGSSFKHNIIFDTKGMYNDMFNDKNTIYWCVRNKVNKRKIISYSGKAPCACCGELSALKENENNEYSDYEGDFYNSRYENTDSILCWSCRDDKICAGCSSERHIYVVNPGTENETYLCRDCIREELKKCPCCHKIFYPTTPKKRAITFSIVNPKKIFYEQVYYGYPVDSINNFDTNIAKLDKFEFGRVGKILSRGIINAGPFCQECFDRINPSSAIAKYSKRYEDDKRKNRWWSSIDEKISKYGEPYNLKLVQIKRTKQRPPRINKVSFNKHPFRSWIGNDELSRSELTKYCNNNFEKLI